MGKTADLTVVQKTIIKTLHKEGKSQTFIEKKNWTVAQWSKVLFSDESKFCISFGNQGSRVWRKGGEAHSPSCLKSSVKFPVCDDLGCNVICWCWSIVFFENQCHCTRLPRHFGALHASFC